MKFFGVVIVLFIFLGCSVKEELKEVNNQKKIEIQDLLEIPQNVEYYTQGIENQLYTIQKSYETTYFGMWNIEEPEQTLKEIKWPFRAFSVGKSYGDNLVPIKQSFFDLMYEESNFGTYKSINKKALTLKYSNIRALPTQKPLFRDPSIAGEGFPFDYLQNSSINANVPIFISHYSKDKQWVFIFSSITYGWLRSDEIVMIDDRHASLWKNAQQVYIIQEGFPLFALSGEPLFNTRVGMLFALVDEDDDNYTVLIVSTYKNNEAMYNKSTIPKSIASLKPLELNTSNLNKIITEVSKTNYGWGGVYEQRDCSSTLMDLYAPFGIALPRNSLKQGQFGEVIDLSKLDDKEKEKIIKEKGIPFKTLLYKKGHIVLYVGIYNDEIIIFQNVWGIQLMKNNKSGRLIIGKTVFSTLKLGKEVQNYNEKAELLRNIKSMNIITRAKL